ncbi:hypothetical protein BS17DRAFT_806992 [Gyrodon lividus]|nr:hypothetical protein BS17DRAFT_806992 [Gyrodon lividus]
MMAGKGHYEQSAAHKAPIITVGNITPKALRSWEMGCKQYFLHRSIDSAEQVQKIALNLQDPRIQDWYLNDYDRIDKLTFSAFMEEVRSCWLPSDWAAITRQKMLASTQGNKAFSEWAIDVQTQNTILRGTTSHLTDASLKYYLEAHIHPNLACEYRAMEYSTEDVLRKWIEKVRLLDEKRQRDVAKHKEAVDVAIRAVARPAPWTSTSSSKTQSSKGGGDAVKSSTTNKFLCLPALTMDERKILQDNEGCFKCRCPFQKHTSRDCPYNFPDPKTYKPLTADDIAAKKLKTTPIAAIDIEHTVAVVMPSAVLGDGTDSGDDSD